MTTYKEENRKRLIQLIDQISFEKEPEGWTHVTTMAVGGLEAVGFSQFGPYLLVVSSSGRSLISCETGKKIARDYEAYAGLSKAGLHCQGIGVAAEELVQLSGIYGGGMPLGNSAGDCLEVVHPDWPESNLILSKPFKSPLVPGHQSDCRIIYVEHVRAYGFSWCGNYIVAACSSDLDLWARNSKL